MGQTTFVERMRRCGGAWASYASLISNLNPIERLDKLEKSFIASWNSFTAEGQEEEFLSFFRWIMEAAEDFAEYVRPDQDRESESVRIGREHTRAICAMQLYQKIPPNREFDPPPAMHRATREEMLLEIAS
jgi:hypothetical protein